MKETTSILIVWLLSATLAAVQAQQICTTNSGSITITGYNGTPLAVTIPNKLNIPASVTRSDNMHSIRAA
jgi:hypothetical protein